MEKKESKGLWLPMQPGIDGEQFQLELNKNEFSTSLFKKEMFNFFYNRQPLRRKVTIFTNKTGYRLIRQSIKNLQMIKRLRKHGTNNNSRSSRTTM